MTRHNRNLRLITLSPEQHAQTCDYWYLVHVDHGTSHTGFTTERGLLRYLGERGLELAEPLPKLGAYSCQALTGEYREKAWMSYDEFYALQGERTRALSNGSYTLAIITKDADGIRTVHTLNPNMRDRVVYDYNESRMLMR
ncbi:hypothetical protein [Pseudomonas citronellolis]|uniref:hypothetical protein n=1 Tax=Pseudomonas citronellolis TaxID=53408 RepID=UPI00248DC317|nr:hypothetical protein [Pseudomonas citronellolis]